MMKPGGHGRFRAVCLGAMLAAWCASNTARAADAGIENPTDTPTDAPTAKTGTDSDRPQAQSPESGAQPDTPSGSPNAPGAETTPPESSPASPDGLIPPKLVDYVSAPYPEAALQEGLEGEVQANIDIDEKGNVTAVSVVTPAGHGFDEAAEAAMKGFRFEPAKKDGVPIPSRVLYAYRFHLDEAGTDETESGQAPEEIPPAILSGMVKDMDDAPLAGAFVTLKKVADEAGAPVAASEPIQVVSDEAGRFQSPKLDGGAYKVEVFNPGFLPFSAEETLVAGEDREIVYRLETEGAMYETVVRGKRPSREVTRREITMREINKIPGTSGDALRAVQNMPGLARPVFNGGELLVRGSAPEDTRAYFDGMETPLVYHFGGLTSVINSDLIDKIEFYPGNFSVRYGKSMGGVIDVETKTPATDRFHGYIDADVWDAGALIEGPLGKNWSIALSARRSYVDAVLSHIDFGDLQMTVAPRYYDFQLIADYHPSKSDHLKLFAYGTDDRMVMIWDEADDPFWGSGVDAHMMTYQAQAEWTHRFNDFIKNDARLSFGYWGGQYNEGIMNQDWNMMPLMIRDELTLDFGKRATLRMGVDDKLEWAIVKMKVPADYGGEGEMGRPFSEDYFLTFKGTKFNYSLGTYAELALNLLDNLQTIFGVRGEYFSQIDRWGVDPRFSVRYEILPKTALKGGVGLFNQPADLAQGDDDYGNPHLELSYALHYSIGLEQQILDNMELSVEGFYKDMRRLIRMSDDLVERGGELVPERFDNSGKGRVYGMEAQFKYNPTQRFFGWITYTLMKSERIDSPGAKARPFDYDQTHILTAVGSVHLGWGVDVGLRFRLTTGNPYTPVIGASYDAAGDEFVPAYGETNSGRMPLFHQLDLRVDKKWQWKYLAFTAYLDVQNVYFAKNTEFYVYSYNYSERGKVSGLPILPSLGLKLEY